MQTDCTEMECSTCYKREMDQTKDNWTLHTKSFMAPALILFILLLVKDLLVYGLSVNLHSKHEEMNVQFSYTHDNDYA